MGIKATSPRLALTAPAPSRLPTPEHVIERTQDADGQRRGCDDRPEPATLERP